MNRESVIPAQAGIQRIKNSPRKRDNNTALSASRGVFFVLDSGVRRNDGLRTRRQ